MILAVQRAQPDDQYGDVFVDTDKSMEVYREWLAMAKPAGQYGRGNLRRPKWLERSVRPEDSVYRLSP
ncbi:MAG: hypothetical protein C4341_02455 [Armatimonadota bacterium]